jgi:predicted small secreted protein
MTPSARVCLRSLALVVAALALAACETTGTGTDVKPEAAKEAAKPPEPPMTHTRAAEQCWMSTEKIATTMSLDKRADVVDKCIEQKMKGGTAAAEPAPEAKKKKPETAASDTQKKKPAAAGEKKDDKDKKDKKPADAEAPDKKP